MINKNLLHGLRPDFNEKNIERVLILKNLNEIKIIMRKRSAKMMKIAKLPKMI